ncbi:MULTISPECIES: hypothetical protein [Halobacterium]|uniref:hypothetical protein n=1 Tax=Halobacterium TaxID=2239 RepID=UPI00073E9D8D|nr:MULTISPECIES: hypothetical protein [Halobacterium]MCG1002866.1 hypothetical protein [Halobacterium noricense]
MINTLPPTVLAAGAALLGVLLGSITVGSVAYYRSRKRAIDEEVDEATDPLVADDSTVGDAVELEPIDTRSGIAGLLSAWQRRRKEQRLAEKGYVKWIRIGSSVQSPEWVKPSYRGTGAGEYYDREDEVTYLFPKEAMLPDSTTGAWVAMHRENEADPVNLRDPVMPAAPADRLQEIINLEAEAEQPGFLDQLDISGTQAFIVITVVLFLVYAASQVM